MIYTHVIKDMRNQVASPFDLLPNKGTMTPRKALSPGER